MTEREFTRRCNLKGFKVSWIEEYWMYRGRMLSLLILTRGKMQIRLTVYRDELKKHPSEIYRKAWEIVLRKTKEDDNSIELNSGNTLWDQICKGFFAKEGNNERGNVGRAGRGTS